MNLQSLAFHKTWLLVTTFVVISFGRIFALGTRRACALDVGLAVVAV
jgi:hypothetical protein